MKILHLDSRLTGVLENQSTPKQRPHTCDNHKGVDRFRSNRKQSTLPCVAIWRHSAARSAVERPDQREDTDQGQRAVEARNRPGQDDLMPGTLVRVGILVH